MLSLALGIGANTAIFSLIDALMLRLLPVREPQQLVQFMSAYPGEPRMNAFTYAHYARVRDASLLGLDRRGASAPDPDSRRGGAARGIRLVRDGNFFSALSVEPALGRVLMSQDDRIGGCGSASDRLGLMLRMGRESDQEDGTW